MRGEFINSGLGRSDGSLSVRGFRLGNIGFELGVRRSLRQTGDLGDSVG
jgi:hypothetical protein